MSRREAGEGTGFRGDSLTYGTTEQTTGVLGDKIKNFGIRFRNI